MDAALWAVAPTLIVLFFAFGVGAYHAFALRGPLKPTSARLLHAHIGGTLLGLAMKFGPRPTHYVEAQYAYVVDDKTYIGKGRLYFVGKDAAQAYIASHNRFSEIRAFFFPTHPQDSRLVSVVPRGAAIVTAAIAMFGIGFIVTIAATLDRKSDVEQTRDIIESVLPD